MVTFNQLIKQLKNKEIYMLIGNGSKNQFRYITDLRNVEIIRTKENSLARENRELFKRKL